jgi:NarL family two-component system response regulator LiaR
MPIRVLIVDDHAVVRQSLRQVLDALPELEIIGEAADGAMAVQLAQSLQPPPDVILLDLLMPGMSGIEVIQRIIELKLPCRLLALSSSLEDQIVTEALRAGAHGYILKSSRVTEVVDAIQRVAAGESALDPAITRLLIHQTRHTDPLEALTTRERETFDQLARGKSNSEIADALNISEITVRTHIAAILDKLTLRDRTQVVIYALKRGLVRIDDLP